MGITALLAFTFALVLTSCSKDEADNYDFHITRVDSTAASVDSTAATTLIVSSYAVSENEQIMFSKKGIIDVVDNNTESPIWQLSYQEIAKQLDIDYSKILSLQITRDCILSNGLWRFDVRFNGQKEGTAYAIDIDPKDGEIEWVITLEEMPNNNIEIKIFL